MNKIYIKDRRFSSLSPMNFNGTPETIQEEIIKEFNYMEKEIKKEVESYKEGSLRLVPEPYGYDGGVDYKFVFERLETDVECDYRLKREAKKAEAEAKKKQTAKEKRRAQYEKLKKEFENDA